MLRQDIHPRHDGAEPAFGSPARRRAIIAVLVAALILDGVDQQMLPLASPIMMGEWKLSYAQMGHALVSALIGMTIGTMIGGIAGDRLGKRRVVIVSTAAFALATLTIGLASSITQVAILRFLSGLAFGAIMPNAIAIASLLAAPATRVRVVALLVVCIPVGAMLGALAGGWLLPTLGWRWTFILSGALPLGLAGAMIYLLPRFEPTVPASDRPGAEAAPLGTEPRGGKAVRFAGFDQILGAKTRQLTLMVWLMFFANGYGVYAFANWMPVILSHAGLSIEQASHAIFAFTLAAIIGSYVATLAIERRGTVFAAFLFISLVCISVAMLIGTFSSEPTPILLAVLALVLCGLVFGALQTTCYVFASSSYPDEVGATGIGAAVTFNRSGGMVAILLSGTILEGADGNPVLLLLVILLLMLAVCGVLAATRRSLAVRYAALRR